MTTVDPREDPPTEASELETLLGFLDYQRGTIALKTDGMDDVHELQQRIRRTVGKWVNTNHRRRPMIIPVVVEA